MNYLDEINRRGILPALCTEYSGGECIEQSPKELADFCRWLESKDIKKYLEIGVSQGGLLRFMAAVMGFESYGIDRGVPVSMKDVQKVFVGDCRGGEAKAFAKENGPYDLVLIDASHDFEGISQDAKIYGPLATKVLAFHDIAGLRECEGAARHWAGIKKKYKKRAIEFIDPECPVGIGAVLL